MAFGHGKRGRILLGKYDVSPWLRGWGGGQTLDLSDVTTLTKNSKVYIAGQADGRVSLDGLFDGAANALQAILDAFKTDSKNDVDWPYMLAHQGYATIGSRVRIGQGKLATSEIAGSVNDAVQATAEIQCSDADENGVLLADLAARTGTVNGSAVDNAAGTANGGIGTLQVTAFSGFASVTVKVQHSTDNSVWTDLITFTAVTATVAQLSQLADGATVNRYLRYSISAVTGTGSLTFTVGFARR